MPITTDQNVEYATDGVLTLTGFRLSDAGTMADGDRDLEHRARFDVPDDSQPSLQHSIEVLDAWTEARAVGRQFTYAVRDAHTDMLLGGCELRPTTPGTGALSYWTYPAYRGRGVAGRAVTLALELARERHAFGRVVAWVDSDNRASLALLRRSGFKAHGQRGNWLDSPWQFAIRCRPMEDPLVILRMP